MVSVKNQTKKEDTEKEDEFWDSVSIHSLSKFWKREDEVWDKIYEENKMPDKKRCEWCGEDPLYQKYHDKEL